MSINDTCTKDQRSARREAQGVAFDFIMELHDLMERWQPRMEAVGGRRAGGSFEDSAGSLAMMLCALADSRLSKDTVASRLEVMTRAHKASFDIHDAIRVVALHLDWMGWNERQREDVFCPTCGEPWDLLFTQDGRNLRCGANTCSACEAPGCEEVTS